MALMASAIMESTSEPVAGSMRGGMCMVTGEGLRRFRGTAKQKGLCRIEN